MTIHSAGLLLYRLAPGPGPSDVEVLLVHPGGPFFSKKDAGAWSIPKGEYDPAEEDALSAAWREFAEETGGILPVGAGIDLGWIEQRRGKVVHAFGIEGALDPLMLTSNDFEMEWPPHSGRAQRFPEVDRAEWFDIAAARQKILPRQAVFLERLLDALSDPSREPASSA